jgi:UDP-3-O-acyl-N-acetylglucosamine deacetylase
MHFFGEYQMTSFEPGRIISGSEREVVASFNKFNSQTVDQEMMAEDPGFHGDMALSLGEEACVTGPGTFLGKATRRLCFRPTSESGWFFDRDDLQDQMPIGVVVSNVWKTVRNIVLCSGSPHNYMRMVEHIVALKVGMGIDNMMLSVDSGDPPLFDRGSLDLVEAVEKAGVSQAGHRAKYVTVRAPVALGGPGGSFLAFLPAEGGSRELYVDCALDFKSAIGRQRIRFNVNRKTFRHGALARTNTTLLMMLFSKTIGRLFADVRNLGYTMKNIQIAGRWRYVNKPGLIHNGKSLEAAWHRATLDLLAAIALIDKGRFAGTILSYKSGHTLDAHAVRELYHREMLVEL